MGKQRQEDGDTQDRQRETERKRARENVRRLSEPLASGLTQNHRDGPDRSTPPPPQRAAPLPQTTRPPPPLLGADAMGRGAACCCLHASARRIDECRAMRTGRTRRGPPQHALQKANHRGALVRRAIRRSAGAVGSRCRWRGRACPILDIRWARGTTSRDGAFRSPTQAASRAVRGTTSRRQAVAYYRRRLKLRQDGRRSRTARRPSSGPRMCISTRRALEVAPLIRRGVSENARASRAQAFARCKDAQATNALLWSGFGCTKAHLRASKEDSLPRGG